LQTSSKIVASFKDACDFAAKRVEEHVTAHLIPGFALQITRLLGSHCTRPHETISQTNALTIMCQYLKE
jgi:hypothetical protein